MISQVFWSFSITDPMEWLEKQRTADTPDDDVWVYELFIHSSFKVSVDTELLVLTECGVLLEGEEQNTGVVTSALLKMLDEDETKLFGAAEDEILIYNRRDLASSLLLNLELEDYYGRDNDNIDFAWALLHSWETNKDRERAHKARDYLCNIVAKMLAEEELAEAEIEG